MSFYQVKVFGENCEMLHIERFNQKDLAELYMAVERTAKDVNKLILLKNTAPIEYWMRDYEGNRYSEEWTKKEKS